jgi:hypothetical protein
VIKAFFISCNVSKNLLEKVLEHFQVIARRYGDNVSRIERYGFNLILLKDSGDEWNSDFNKISFIAGKINAHPEQWDRFLRVEISPECLQIENDYAGSIPVFYSQKNGFVASNIEPCVYLATNSTLSDISYENIYGFLRYGHFIWDETAWKHIKQILPDSRYRFSSEGVLISTEYLQTIKATDSRATFTDKVIADDLFELNRSLVTRSLVDSDEIILPLSSGYDSRMIFSVLANDKQLSCKTRCFTYGSIGSIEVEGGRRLTKLKGVDWHYVNLPCRFLDKRYLKEIADIFGASLHMHGMYQVEFYEQIKSKYGISPSARLTSGFMTGVPAGQHNSLLQITELDSRLTDVMNHFSQSKVWKDEDLEKMPVFAGKQYLEIAEQRFRLAFDRFEGEIYQKTVMFDVWTRQRNFISYYPRTLEWQIPTVSPHMCAEYANFFMSLNEDHLRNRRAVELMFLKCYPDIAKVASNSNGIACLGSQFETSLLFLSRIFNYLNFPNPLPRKFRNIPIELDIQAVKNCKGDSFYPLLDDTKEIREFTAAFGGMKMFHNLYCRALNGDRHAYARAVTLQAIVLSGLLEYSSFDNFGK